MRRMLCNTGRMSNTLTANQQWRHTRIAGPAADMADRDRDWLREREKYLTNSFSVINCKLFNAFVAVCLSLSLSPSRSALDFN